MKKLSYIAIGLIVGLAIGLTSTAYAQDVTAAFSKFIFKVNGVEKPLDADPLVYQGSTYLPVRTVANLLGYDVTYKADEKTIEMNNSVVGVTNIIPTGGHSLIETPIPQMTLKQINSLIHDAKSDIDDYAILLDDRSGYSEAEKENFRTKKTEAEARLVELETQKATLEAQPTPTP